MRAIRPARVVPALERLQAEIQQRMQEEQQATQAAANLASKHGAMLKIIIGNIGK